MSTDDELQELLADFHFPPARFEVGYVSVEVDQLIDRLRAAAARGDSIGGLIESTQLHTAGFREGYEVSDVESFLHRVAIAAGSELGEREPAVPAPAPPRRARGAARTGDGVIVEHRGLLSRLRHQK